MFRYPSGLRKHNRRKTPCGAVCATAPLIIDTATCARCGRQFATRGSARRHVTQRCRVADPDILSEDVERLHAQVDTLAAELKELKGSGRVTTNNVQNIGHQGNTQHIEHQNNTQNITIVQKLVCFGEEAKVENLCVGLLEAACRATTPDDQIDTLFMGIIKSVLQDETQPQNATAYAISDRSTKARFLRRKYAGATEAAWKAQGEWMSKQEIGRWLLRRLMDVDRAAQTVEHRSLVTKAIDEWPRHHLRLMSGTRVMGLLAETRDWMRDKCAGRLTPALKQDESAAAAEAEEKRHRSYQEARSDHVTPEHVFALANKYAEEDDESEKWMRGLKLLRGLYAAMEGKEIKNIVVLRTEQGEILISQGGGQWEIKSAEWAGPRIMKRVQAKLQEAITAAADGREGHEIIELAMSERMQEVCMRSGKPRSWVREYREELTQ